MNREEVNLVGFEIVAYAGEARSKLMTALNEAKNGNYEEADKLVKEARETLADAHKTQTGVLAAEAEGKVNDTGFIMVHGQDHLMTAMLLADLMEHLIELYKRGDS